MIPPNMEVIWSGGEGLSSYCGPSTLGNGTTFPESVKPGDYKDLQQGVLGPTMIRKIKDQLDAGMRDAHIKKVLGVSRVEIEKVRTGL